MTADSPITRGFVLRVVIKAALLFVLLNILWAFLNPLPTLGRATLHNRILPGRERLPFGENPASYNLSLYQLDAMIATHEIARTKPADEYRVIIIGDSSVWGTLLEPQDTLAGKLNDLNLTAPDGRHIEFYNLGYPTISVTKDLMLLNRIMPYEPDALIWVTTLEAMPAHKQLSSPIVQNNPADVRRLITEYDLSIDPLSPEFVEGDFPDRTIVGQRRAIADVVRLNLYAVMWAATGIDQLYPETYELRAEDLEPSTDFYGLADPLDESDLSFDVLNAGLELAGDIPILIVNEPMFISNGENSDIRYNFYYPIWAYDQYRVLMSDQAAAHGWNYLDTWNLVSGDEFTNSAIHMTPAGEAQLADEIAAALLPLLTD